MIVYLVSDAIDLHTLQLTPAATIEIQNGLPLWCWRTQAVLEKRPLNECCFCYIHCVSKKCHYLVFPQL